MEKILIVEDDLEVSEMLEKILQESYQVVLSYSGTEALLQLQTQSFALILLDIMLPGKNGQEVLREIREFSPTPVIMLTALSDKQLVVECLKQGADDYITKPFDRGELMARIAVQLRNKPAHACLPAEDMKIKEIKLDKDLFKITREQQEVPLTKKEFVLLEILGRYPERVFTKADLYELVWEEPYFGDENTLNVHLSNLRKKIQLLDATQEYIETIWGIGVKLAK